MIICKYCQAPALFTFKNGITCCSKNVSGCPVIRQRKKVKCFEKYGNENFRNTARNKQTKEEKYGDANYNNRVQAKETNIVKYGVENVSQLAAVKLSKLNTFNTNFRNEPEKLAGLADRRRTTWLSNDVESIITKSKKTTLDRYGVDNIQKLEEVAHRTSLKNTVNAKERLAKAKQTIRERYGVDYISQVSEIHEKQQKLRWKNYTLPSGKIIKIQGFENFALDILLTTTDENNIVTSRKDIPNIWYYHLDKKRRYYPDILVSGITIIEVKSEYTYRMYEAINLKKKDACTQAGFNFEFWIFNKTGSSLRKQIYPSGTI